MLSWCYIHNVLFFFNDTATTEIYTLSLHDALPISGAPSSVITPMATKAATPSTTSTAIVIRSPLRTFGRSFPLSSRALRSEEHTSELQSRQYLVCRLLLEKKKHTTPSNNKLSAAAY